VVKNRRPARANSPEWVMCEGAYLRNAASAPVASAAHPLSSSVLLQYLDLSGWQVDVRESGSAYSAVAGRGKDRLAAWGLSHSAVVALLFEHARGAPFPEGQATFS
jgi:hypothetical protein